MITVLLARISNMKKTLAFILFLLISTNSFATVTFITSTSAGSTNAANVTTPAIDTTGADFIGICATSATSPTITDSKSNTWTALNSYTNAGGNIITAYYAAAPTVGSGHTFTNTSVVPSMSVFAFSGVKQSSPFDQQNGATAQSVTSKATGSITPSENNELILTCLAIGSSLASDYVVDSGVSTPEAYIPVVGGQHYGNGGGYKIQAGAAAINPTWSGSSGDFAVSVASFKAAAAAAAAYSPSLFWDNI